MATNTEVSRAVDWSHRVPDDQWRVYAGVIAEARTAGIEFALGGAFALAAYTGDLRNTKDLDLYIRPEDRDAMVAAMLRAGLSDYHETLPYDPAWIYRAHTGDIIVDAIWAMANQRARVDEDWLRRGRLIEIHGERLRVLPAEELVWAKLYIVQRGRCDWPDILNLLDATAPELDWDRLVARVGEDVRLLAGVMNAFAWLVPPRARLVPAEVWRRVGLEPPGDGEDGAAADIVRQRAALIESRPWLVSLQC